MLSRRNNGSERGVSNEGAIKINFSSKGFGEDVQFGRLARDWSRRNYRHSSFRIIDTRLSRYESALSEQQVSIDVGGYCCALRNDEVPPIHDWYGGTEGIKARSLDFASSAGVFSPCNSLAPRSKAFVPSARFNESTLRAS